VTLYFQAKVYVETICPWVSEDECSPKLITIAINKYREKFRIQFEKQKLHCVYLLALQEDIGIETDEEYGAVIPNS